MNRISTYFENLPISWYKIILIVLAVSLFQLIQQYAYHLSSAFDFSFSWYAVIIKVVLSNITWLLFAPGLYQMGVRIVRLAPQWVNYVRLLFILPFLAVLHQILAQWFYHVSYYLESGYMRDLFGSNGMTAWITGSFSSLLEAVVIVIVFLAIDYQQKYSDKERDLARAQLEALKMQLHPHFLFNTLHSISSMIDIDIRKAQKMITNVGDLLRTMLEQEEREWVTVEKEMIFVKNYLELEQIRFQDRMQVEFKIDTNALKAFLPGMILQPLIENSIKHGVAKSTSLSRILVEVNRYQNGTSKVWLQLIVQNVCDGSEAHFLSAREGFGVGLKNVERRLFQNYGEQHFSSFDKVNAGQYKSEIRIPWNIK